MSLRDATSIAEMARKSVELRIQMLHYVQSQGFYDYNKAFLGAMLGFNANQPNARDVEAVDTIVASSRLAWKEGQTSLLAPAMTSVIAAAAQQLDMNETVITWDDMPDHGGVIFLPEPIYVQMLAGKRVGLSAITWTPVVSYVGEHAQSAIVVAGYSDPSDMDDEEMHALERASRTMPRIKMVRGPYMPSYLQLVTLDVPAGHAALGSLHEDEKVVMKSWTTTNEDKILVHDEPGKMSMLLRILYSFWMISQQPIAVSAQPEMPKNTQRRAIRASLIHATRVVMLRRSSDVGHHPHGESRWGYSVRFVVRGHWRRLVDANGQKYRIWINAYIKGPEDAPLLGGEKVTVLGR